jgi:RNA polymerase sigma-70 factor, ECF subfamily
LSIPPPELKQIIHQAQNGDRDAVAQLYEIHAQAIYRYIVHRVPTTVDAEDLTAEVFVKMVEGLPKYHATDIPFEAWLYRIAAARVADYYRLHARRPVTDLSDDIPENEPHVEEEIVHEQELGSLHDAIQQLNHDQQTVLILRFVERKSHEEVGRILNKSESAVKTIQYRALIELAKLMGSEKEIRHYLRGSHD